MSKKKNNPKVAEDNPSKKTCNATNKGKMPKDKNPLFTTTITFDSVVEPVYFNELLEDVNNQLYYSNTIINNLKETIEKKDAIINEQKFIINMQNECNAHLSELLAYCMKKVAWLEEHLGVFNKRKYEKFKLNCI